MGLRKTKSGFWFFIAALFIAISPLLIIFSQSVQAQEPVSNESEVEYWAVIVGVSDYISAALDTGNISDAEDLYSELSPIWGQDHIKLLVDDEATKANISDAICDWLDEHEDFNDVVFFYFSGHGNRGVIAPYDASKYVSSKDISADELQRWLDGLESNNVVVVLDSCLSGSFINDLSETGRIILTASEAHQGSFYSTYLGNCIFTYYLLSALDDFSNVDSDEDYKISVEEVFTYVEPRVIERVESWDESQNPQMDDKYDGDLELFYEATIYVNPEIESLILNVDGVMYSSQHCPKTFRWIPNSSHSFMLDSMDPAWLSSSPITISQGGDYRMVYLEVESEYGDPQGEGWYLRGTTVNVSVSSPVGMIVRDVFTGWSFDSTETTTNTTVYMIGSEKVIAHWRKDYIQLYILVAGIVAVVVVIIALVTFSLVKKRRKTKLMITPTDVVPSAVQQNESAAPR